MNNLALWIAGCTLTSLALTPASHAFSLVVVDPAGPGRAWGKQVGDLNGDGRADLLAGGNQPGTAGLYWYANPTWTKRTIDATARISTDMEVVDLDGDGDQDVVAIIYASVNNTLAWFENMGGSWRQHLLSSNKTLHDLELKDLDGDGRLDIVGRNQGATGNVLHFWRQLSLTNWAYSSLPLPDAGEGLLVTDVNRDRKPDVIVSRYWLKNVSTAGSLSFQRYKYSNTAATRAYITAGNLNGGAGFLDIVVSPAEPSFAGETGRVTWYQGPATPERGPWQERLIEGNVAYVVHFVGVADFDGDGHPDVATAMTHRNADPKIKLYLNHAGTGAFGAPVIVANTSSHSMKIIDVDGRPALFGADYDETPTTPIKLWRQP